MLNMKKGKKKTKKTDDAALIEKQKLAEAKRRKEYYIFNIKLIEVSFKKLNFFEWASEHSSP